VRALALKVITDDTSILLDPGCALGPLPDFPIPHPFEYLALKQCSQAIIDASIDARLIAISHYHHDHYKPLTINYEYLGTTPAIFQQIYKGKMVFAKSPDSQIGNNQRERARLFQRQLEEFNVSFIPCDGRTFEFGHTILRFSPPLPHGALGSRLGSLIGTSIQDEEQCLCFCPDVQGPTVRSTFEWIIAQEPRILILGGPPLFFPPSKFSEESRINFYYFIDQLANKVKKIIMDHHIFRHSSGLHDFQKLKAKLKQQGCILNNFAEQMGIKGKFFEASRHQLYSKFPPNTHFLLWAQAPKKKREKSPPPLPNEFPPPLLL